MRTIYFLAFIAISLTACQLKNEPERVITQKQTMPPHADRKITVEKLQVNVPPAEGGITIAELYAHKDTYAGKTVKIKGQVTKFNAKIMKKNWIHIQDGTDFSGKFDLAANSDITVSVGETITLEGKVLLNKDFGSGYFYEVLLEDARLIQMQ